MSLSVEPDSCHGISVYEEVSNRKVKTFYVCVKSEHDPSFEVRTTCLPSYLLYHPSSDVGSHAIVALVAHIPMLNG